MKEQDKALLPISASLHDSVSMGKNPYPEVVPGSLGFGDLCRKSFAWWLDVEHVEWLNSSAL